MKIALVQTNPTIGDFVGNSRKILDYSQKAADSGAHLVIFPELTVSGYPPLDLLERDSFAVDQTRVVDDMVAKLPDIDVMFGCIEKREGRDGKPFFNTVCVARSGKIIHRVRKRRVPVDRVFTENRYFEPGDLTELYRLGALKIAVTIGDAVDSDSCDESRPDPLAELMDHYESSGEQVDLMVTVSASSFYRGKLSLRNTQFALFSRKYRLPVIFVNQVGGQDSLLFDGHSLALDEDGQLIAQARGFSEDMVVIDTRTRTGSIRAIHPPEDPGCIHDALVMGLRDYVRKTGFSSVVLGLSGGIDSALTAALAVAALGPNHVVGIALPSPYSSDDSVEDARALAENCGIRFEVLPIADLFQGYRNHLDTLFTGLKEDVTEQNIQARIRGNLLMAVSNKLGYLLLSTGNRSELAVGYCTLYGDMSGGLAVISDVPKQLVYELASYVNRERTIIPERTIRKPPTAELRPNQCDQDDLPPYELLDDVIERYLENGIGREELINAGYDADMVNDVIRRIWVNEYKRKQAPIGLKVSGRRGDRNRCFPNVHQYRG
ncbi:MAG: NAD+ synthase [Desulfobacterales bacterium]|nr:MAG: NAD+ synthase [Desulfobacterales bacterium]